MYKLEALEWTNNRKEIKKVNLKKLKIENENLRKIVNLLLFAIALILNQLPNFDTNITVQIIVYLIYLYLIYLGMKALKKEMK